MCQKFEATAAAVLKGAEPEFVSLLTATGIAATPDGEAAINAYKAAEQSLADWVPGTETQTVIEAVNAAVSVFNVLPFPSDAKLLVDAISAIFATVLGIIKANTPAPAAASAATPELAAHAQVEHAESVASDTETTVLALTGYKPGWVTRTKVMMGDHGAIASEWKNKVWKKAVAESDPKYASLYTGGDLTKN